MSCRDLHRLAGGAVAGVGIGLGSVTMPSVVVVDGAWVSLVAVVSGGTVSPSVVSKVLPLPVK